MNKLKKRAMRLIMGPLRKSRSVNRWYINEVSPSKDDDSAKGSNSRKRKLSDMLGSRWITEELTRFYDAYRKYGKDWKKLLVAGAVRNRSPEMVEAIYTMNRAYLSLPDGTASATGLIAMVTDHYSNLVGIFKFRWEAEDLEIKFCTPAEVTERILKGRMD